jgi:signal recognition particle subunit SRP54
VDEKQVNQLVNEFERALIKADVSLEIVGDLGKRIKNRVLTEQPPAGITRRDYMVKVIYDELVNLLGGETTHVVWPKRDKPFVILMVGLQGSGKTTTAAKIAKFYLKRSYKVGLVAADTFRLGAKEQLIQLGQKIGAPVYTSDYDAIMIAQKGIEELKKQGCNLLLIDTAGRHKEEKGLLQEMVKLQKTINPDSVYLILDGTIGQLAKAQAEAFARSVPIGYIIITKLDGSAKGGGAISAAAATGARILFIGVGEGLDDLEVFDPPSFISRLLGLGDIQALAEKVKEAQINEKQLEEIITTGRFTLVDFEFYLDSMNKMGSLSKILNLVPGFSNIPTEITKNAEVDLRKWKIILNSLNKAEKLNPQIINSSRIRRIAIGSGSKQEDVRSLLKRYELMRNQMKLLKRNRSLLKKLGAYKF